MEGCASLKKARGFQKKLVKNKTEDFAIITAEFAAILANDKLNKGKCLAPRSWSRHG